jgi:hypothetical protein
VYLVANGTPPIFYQVRVKITPNVLLALNAKRPLDSFATVERLPGTSPLVSWQPIADRLGISPG